MFFFFRLSYSSSACGTGLWETCRRGNKIFCVHSTNLCDWLHDVRVWGKANGQPDIDGYQWKRRSHRPVFGLMVDMDKNEVLWKKKVTNQQNWTWKEGLLYMTDKVCGLLVSSASDDGEEWKLKRLARFDVETGKQLSDHKQEDKEKLWVTDKLRLAIGGETVALVSRTIGQIWLTVPPTPTPTANFCQLVDVATGRVRRHVHLSYGDFTDPEPVEICGCCTEKKPDVPQRALFGDRILAMCTSHTQEMVNEDETKYYRVPVTIFAFFDLQALTKKTKKFSMPATMSADGKCMEEEMELPEITPRMVFLPGFEALAPSVTGNIWFLLTWSEKEDSDEEGKVKCYVHALDVNRSITAFWDRSLDSENKVQ